jgi:hypothetical protein
MNSFIRHPISAWVLLIILHLTLMQSAIAQIYNPIVFDNYPNAGVGIQRSGSGFILLGNGAEYENGERMDAFKIALLDSVGNLNQTKTIGKAGKLWQPWWGGFMKDSTSGYIALGGSREINSNNWVPLIAKFTLLGDTAWVREYLQLGRAGFYDGLVTPEGDYLLVGVVYPAATPTLGDVLLVKTDTSGTVLWSRTFGGGANDVGGSIGRLSNGNYVIGAGSDSFSPDGITDGWTIIVDSQGIQLNNFTIGTIGDDSGVFVYPSGANSFFYVQKIDTVLNQGDYRYPLRVGLHQSDGTENWSHIFSTRSHQEPFSGLVLPDSSFLLMGYIVNYQGSTSRPGWLVNISKTGQVLWERILTDVSRSNILADGLRLPDGRLAFTGNCFPDQKSGSDMYLLILDAKGCFTPGCDSLDVSIDDLAGHDPRLPLRAYPNPATSRLTLAWDVPIPAGTLTVLDAAGRVVLETPLSPGTTEYETDVANLPAGVYVARVGASAVRWVRN